MDIGAWNAGRLRAECGADYRRYKTALDRHYARYFTDRPDERGGHPRKARDLETALPASWGDRLAGLIPAAKLHREHLSGQSSQVLALGLLGAARRRDPSLDWLFANLRPAVPPAGARAAPSSELEFELDPAVLNEHPHVTTVDFLVDAPDLVLCVEAKWAEEGLGTCSCPPPARATSDCSSKVLGRPLYWEAAREALGLPDREKGAPCPMGMAYQAVRNAAAAKALAVDRLPVFALIYDERNPYFGGCGDWPGWPAVLDATINERAVVKFASVSWQQLAPSLDLDDNVREWAREKHQLAV